MKRETDIIVVRYYKDDLTAIKDFLKRSIVTDGEEVTDFLTEVYLKLIGRD